MAILFLLLLLPTQFGKFFFLPSSYIGGLRVDYLAPAIYLIDIVVALIFLSWIYDLVRKKKLPSVLTRIKGFFSQKMVWAIVVLVTTNIIFSQNIPITLFRYFKVVGVVFLFFYFHAVKIQPRGLLLALLATSSIQLFLVTAQVMTGGALQGIFYLLGERTFSLATPGIAKISLQGVEILRGYGSFSHPNSLGGFFLLLYGFALWYEPFQKNTLMRRALLAVCTLLVMFSFSKVAIIGHALIMGYFLMKQRANCTLCTISQIALPLVLGGIFLAGSGDPLSVEKRFYLLKSALEIVKSHPFTGTGLGAYVMAQSSFPHPYPYVFFQPVHNIFVLALAELGIPLFLAVIIFLGKILRSVRWNNCLTALLFVLFFTGMVDHYWLTLEQNILLAPVLFGLVTNTQVRGTISTRKSDD